MRRRDVAALIIRVPIFPEGPARTDELPADLHFRRWTILPDGQITSSYQKSCQAPPAKIFIFHFSEMHDYPLCIPPPLEGRIAIVTDVGSGMRWTQGGSARSRADESILADGQVVWS
jgi:hypothetical protein